MSGRQLGPAGRFAQAWISSKLTPLLICAALLIGAFAVWKLPREESGRFIVPMIDDRVRQMPGASAHAVEVQSPNRWRNCSGRSGRGILYSTSSPGMSMAIVRFYDGRTKKSIVRLNQKLFANFDLIPQGGFEQPLVKPRPHRRCADSRVDALQPPLQRFRFAADRGKLDHYQTGAGCFRGHPDGRAEARSADRAGHGQTRDITCRRYK